LFQAVPADPRAARVHFGYKPGTNLRG
jgi:hypothetical protein